MARKALVLLVRSLAIAVLLIVPGVALGQSPCDLTSYDNWTVIDPTTDPNVWDSFSSPTGDTCFYLAPNDGAYQLNNPITINRTIYLHGADKTHTILRASDPNQPLFVISQQTPEASLISFAQLRLLPTGFGYYPTKSKAIWFQNDSPVTFEMFDAYVDRSEIDIDGPGDYRIQDTQFDELGMNKSPLIVNDPGADVLVVGGGWNGGGKPVHVDFCPGSAGRCVDLNTTCDVSNLKVCVVAGTPCQTNQDCPGPGPDSCALPPTGCGQNQECILDSPLEGNQTQHGVCTTSIFDCSACDPNTNPSSCCNASERCVAVDQDKCETYHALQLQGRLRIVSSGVVMNRGDADFRFEAHAAQGPHVIADVRSEGPKCANNLPATLARVPGTPDANGQEQPDPNAIDLLLLNNYGAWDATINCSPHGNARFVDYNAGGHLWLIGNNSPAGAGRLVTGHAHANATITSLGNRVFGNTDSNGADPLNLLPVDGGTETSFGDLYYREQLYVWYVANDYGHCDDPGQDPCGGDNDCPASVSCVFPINTDGCKDEGDPGFTGDPAHPYYEVCPDGGICISDDNTCGTCNPPHPCTDRRVDFALANGSETELIDSGAVPQFPATDIPHPLRHPTVSDAGGAVAATMVDSADCVDGLCAPYYPDYCQGTCSVTESSCQDATDCTEPGESCTFSDRCALQATLNRALVEKRPALIREGTYIVDRPLYFLHKQQLAEDSDLEAVLDPDGNGKIDGAVKSGLPAGWIVGQNGNVTIQSGGTRVCVDPNFEMVSGTTCESDSDCTDPNMPYCDERVFATQGMAHSVVQGIRFEGVPYGSCSVSTQQTCVADVDCPTNETCDPSTHASTVDIENVPGFANPQRSVTFDGCEFTGGRHAFGNCMRSHIQCDTNRVIGGSFSNAYIGFGVGGANALELLAYDVSFTDNAVAMGHDPNLDDVGRGKWAVIDGTITGTRVQDINIYGGGGLYAHGLDSDSDVVLSQTAQTGTQCSVLFENSDLQPQSPGNAFDFTFPNGVLLLKSRLDPGSARLITTIAGANHLFKLGSIMPGWGQVDLGTDARKYEWLNTIECPAVTCPLALGCHESPVCARTEVSFDSCLTDTPEGLEENMCPVLANCQCVGGQGCNQYESTRVVEQCP